MFGYLNVRYSSCHQTGDIALVGSELPILNGKPITAKGLAFLHLLERDNEHVALRLRLPVRTEQHELAVLRDTSNCIRSRE